VHQARDQEVPLHREHGLDLAAYPEDRIRDRRTGLRTIEAAVKAGVKPDDLLQAFKAYAKETEDYTRSKVCFLDNWFKMRL